MFAESNPKSSRLAAFQGSKFLSGFDPGEPQPCRKGLTRPLCHLRRRWRAEGRALQELLLRCACNAPTTVPLARLLGGCAAPLWEGCSEHFPSRRTNGLHRRQISHLPSARYLTLSQRYLQTLLLLRMHCKPFLHTSTSLCAFMQLRSSNSEETDTRGLGSGLPRACCQGSFSRCGWHEAAGRVCSSTVCSPLGGKHQRGQCLDLSQALC